MSIRVQCGACGSPYQVADASAGKRVKCKKCGTVFVAEVPPPAEDQDVEVEYEVDDTPDVAPPARAAATSVWDAKASVAAAAASAKDDDATATPAWRKPGALVAVAMVAVGGAVIAFMLLNRPAEQTVASSAGAGGPATPSAATRPRATGAAAVAGSSAAAAPSPVESAATDEAEAEIGEASSLFKVDKGKASPAGAVKPPTPPPLPPVPSETPAKPAPTGGSAAPASPAKPTPAVASGKPQAADSGSEPKTPPKTADIRSSPKPTKWLVRPDASKVRPAVVAKNLSVPLGDAELIFPDQPSPFMVALHSRPTGFEWELWNVEKGAKAYSFKSKEVLSEMVMSPDGILGAGIVPGRVNDVETWSLMQGAARRRFREAEGEDTLVPVCFVGERTLVTTVGGSRKLTLWNVATGKSTGEVKLDRDLQFGGKFAHSPGGEFLAMFADTRLLIYNLTTMELAGEVEVPERGEVSLDTAAGLTFSADGLEIAGVFGGRGGPARVVAWDLKTGQVTEDLIAADKPSERLPAGLAQVVRPVAWLLDGTGWLLYGDVAVARAGGKTLFRRPGGAAGDAGVRWRPGDRDSFLAIDGAGAKRVVKAVPVPRPAS